LEFIMYWLFKKTNNILDRKIMVLQVLLWVFMKQYIKNENIHIRTGVVVFIDIFVKRTAIIQIMKNLPQMLRLKNFKTIFTEKQTTFVYICGN